jgi:hypothetical protein
MAIEVMRENSRSCPEGFADVDGTAGTAAAPKYVGGIRKVNAARQAANIR